MGNCRKDDQQNPQLISGGESVYGGAMNPIYLGADIAGAKNTWASALSSTALKATIWLSRKLPKASRSLAHRSPLQQLRDLFRSSAYGG